MPMAHLILLALAFVLFVLAGLQIGQPKLHLGWFGLAALTLAEWLRV